MRGIRGENNVVTFVYILCFLVLCFYGIFMCVSVCVSAFIYFFLLYWIFLSVCLFWTILICLFYFILFYFFYLDACLSSNERDQEKV